MEHCSGWGCVDEGVWVCMRVHGHVLASCVCISQHCVYEGMYVSTLESLIRQFYVALMCSYLAAKMV